MKFVKLTIDGADVVKFGTKYHLVQTGQIEANPIMGDSGTSWPVYFEHIEGQGIGIHSLVPNTCVLGANLAWSCLYV